MSESNAQAEKAKKPATSGSKQRASKKRTPKAPSPGNRQWVVPAFITVGLFGVLWLVVYYITAAAQVVVPVMAALGGWNVVVGMGAMATAFGLATLWK